MIFLAIKNITISLIIYLFLKFVKSFYAKKVKRSIFLHQKAVLDEFC